MWWCSKNDEKNLWRQMVYVNEENKWSPGRTIEGNEVGAKE
jgi:hypothetical protein